jgi:hypothetical protein
MFVYSCIFCTLAVYCQRADLVTPDWIRDGRQRKEVNLQ